MTSKNRGPLIVGLVGAGLILLLAVGLVLPKAKQVRAKQEELSMAQQRQGELMLQLQQLRAAAREAPKDRRALERLQAEVPPVADVPSIMRLLDRVADEAEVDFMSVAPGSPTQLTAPQVSAVPTQITVIGRYFALSSFLVELETLERVSKVTAISVTPGPEGAPQLQANLTAEFYTTDLSSGPGSEPGGTQTGATAPAAPAQAQTATGA